MEFLQRHLPRVYQAVQDALNFFTNFTAQVFGAPPDAPQPRNARTNVPIQRESEGPTAPEETCGKKETDLLTSSPELLCVTEENGDNAKVHPGDEDYRTQETDLRQRKSDPGGRRDLEHKITEDVDIDLHTTAEITRSYEIKVIESTESKNIVVKSHNVQSIINQEQVNPPDLLELEKKGLVGCEIKVSQYEEELTSRAEDLEDSEPLGTSEHKVYKGGQHTGEPSSDGQYEESLFQPITIQSLSFADQKQLVDTTEQEEEEKIESLIEIPTEKWEYNITPEQEAQALEESIDSTVTLEFDVDNILDVIENNKKLVTPVDEPEISSSQGGDSRKTLEDLLETANRLAKHCDLFQKVEDQKGSDNLQDLDETLGSMPASILSTDLGYAEENLTSVDVSLTKSNFSLEHRETKQTDLEEETIKTQSLVLGQSNRSFEEEGKEVSAKDLSKPTNKEDVQGIEGHLTEKQEEKHQFKESERQPNISKKQRIKRRVHFSPSTEDLFKKSERASRNTLQMVCDEILEGELQPGEDREQLRSSYIIKDLDESPSKEREGNYLGGATCSYDSHYDGQSTSEEEETNGLNHSQAVWYDEYPAQAEHGERCDSLGAVTDQNVHVDFKMEELFVTATDSRSTEEHLDHIPSSAETLSVETESAGNRDMSNINNVNLEQTELFTENKDKSNALRETVNTSEKESLAVSDGTEETVRKEDSFLEEEKCQVEYLLEDRKDLLECDPTHVKEFIDDIRQSSDTLDTKNVGLPKDFTDEQKQTDNLFLEQAILGQDYPNKDTDNKQLENIIHYSAHRDITETALAENELTLGQYSIQETDKIIKSGQDGKEVQDETFLSDAKYVLKSFEEQTQSSIVQFEDDTLLGQPVSRNGDDEYPENLHGTQLSTSVDEICMSLVGDVKLRDGPPSEEHKEVFRDAHFEGESEHNNETSTNEMEEQPEHLIEKQSYDYKHEGFPPETSKPQEEDSKVKTGHIEAELLTEQQWVAVDQYGSGNEASLTEGNFTEQMQDGNSFRQLAPTDGSEECPEESYETDPSASLNEVRTSIVQDVLTREGLVPEECSDIFKDANFKAQSKSHNKTITYEIQEHTTVQQNDDYTREDFQLDARESQEDDRKVKNSHTEVEFLNEDQLVDEGHLIVLNEDSLTEIFGNDKLQEDRLKEQPVFRASDEVCHKELVATEQNTSLVVVCKSFVEEILKEEDQVSEEFNDIFKDVNLTTESESIKEFMTHEVHEHTAIIQNDDYIHEHSQANAGESQEEGIQVRVGHIEEDIFSEEQLVVHKEDSLIEVSCNDQLQEGKLQGQPVFRDSDEVCHKELVETEQGTSVIEMHTSMVEHIPKGEDHVSEEFNDNLKDVSFRAEGESIKEIMTHEVQEHTSIIQNDDYIHEHCQPNTGESREEGIQVRVGHIEEDIFSEEQLVVHKEDSLIKVSCNDQLQEGKLQGQPVFRDSDEVCHKELVETEQGTSVIEMHTSIVEHIPKEEDHVSEEFADNLKDVSFGAEGESIKEIMTHEVQEHTSIIQNDDYIHEHSQPNAGESQEEGIQVRVGHIEEDIFSEEQLVVHKEDSLIEVSCNDQLQEGKLQGQPVFRDIDEVCHKELVETEQGTSVIEMHTSMVEHIPKGEDHVSEEFDDNLKDVSFRAEDESIKEIMTHEVQEHTSIIQNDDYIHEHSQPNAGESQEEGIQVRVGHIEEDIFSEEQLVVHKEDSLIEVSCNDQLQEGKLQGQPVFRDIDEVCHKELVETEQGTSVIEMHTSMVEHIPKGEDHVSEEFDDNLKDVSFRAEDESIKEIMTHEVQEHTSIIQNDDYIHEHSQPNAGESQEEDIQIRIRHIEVEVLNEEKFEAEEQLVVHQEDSLIEVSSNDQLQEDKLQGQPVYRDIDEVCHKEPLETEQSTSVIEICASIVEDILKREDKVSEESNVNFRAESESLKEMMTYEVQEHTSIIENDGYVHDHFEQDATESREEDTKVRTDHTEVEFLTEEQFVLKDKVHSAEGTRNDQHYEDSLTSQSVPTESNEVSPEKLHETELNKLTGEICTSIAEGVLIENSLVSEEEKDVFREVSLIAEGEPHSETSTCELDELQQYTDEEKNDNCIYEDSSIKTRKSQGDDSEVSSGHLEVEHLTEEQLVAEGQFKVDNDTSAKDHLQEDRLLEKTVFRDSNEVSPDILHETEPRTTVNEICTSIVNDVLRDSLVSEESRESFSEAGLKEESISLSDTSTREVKELQDHTPEEQNNDYINEVSLIETRNAQEDDSKGNNDHLEAENVTKEPFVTEEQFKVDNEASPIEGSSTGDQLQEDRILGQSDFRDSDELCHKELFETVQSISVIETLTSFVEDVLITEGLVSEQCSEVIKDADFKTESISLNETTTYEIQEQRSEKKNDYTHEEIQLDAKESQEEVNRVKIDHIEKEQLVAEQQLVITNEGSTTEGSQEEDSKVKIGHIEVEFLCEEQLVAEEQLVVHNEDSLTEVSCNDQLQEDRLQEQPISRYIDEVRHEEVYETEQNTSIVEMRPLIVEDDLLRADLVSEEFSGVSKDFTSESESHNESITCEVQANMAVKQNSDYTQIDLQQDASESQVEDSKEKIGHIESEFLTGEQFVVTDEPCPEEGSSNDQLKEGLLKEERESRDSDVLWSKELYETELSALENEVCTSFSEDVQIRDVIGSEDRTEVLTEAGLLQESKSYRATSMSEMEEQEHTAGENNHDHIFEVSLMETSKSQGNDNEVNTVCLEAENITKEQLVSEMQFEVPNEASQIEGSSTDQLQEDGLLQTISKESDEINCKELDGREQSASVIKLCISIADDILRDSLGSEELSEIIKDTHFKAASEFHNETTTCEIQEQSGERKDNDYTHEDFQPETNESQEEDGKFKAGHREVGFLTEEQFVVTFEAYQVEKSSNDQMQEDKLSEHRDFFKEVSLKTENKSDSKMSTCEVEDLQEYMTEEHNDKYLFEDFPIETSKSQEDGKAKIAPTEVEFVPKEHFVVEEQSLLKNAFLTDEDRDHTEEKHDFSNDTNKAYIKIIEEYEPQLEYDNKKLLKESYEDEGFSHQATNAVAQNNSTGHTIVLDTTAEQENQLDKTIQSHEKELDLLSDINSTIYSSLLDQSISVPSEGTDATLDTQKMESVLYASNITASNLDSVLEVTELADFEAENVSKAPKELDLLSEIQCLLSPDHTVRRFPEITDDLNEKVMVSSEEQSSTYAEEQASEISKDLGSSSGSLLEGPTDNWRSTSDSNDETGKDLLLEIQSVITANRDIKTANFSSSDKLVESDVRVEEEDEKESHLTSSDSVHATEEYVRLETSGVEEEVDNEQKVISIENLGFTHEPSQVEGDVSQQDSVFRTVVINTSVLAEAVNEDIINTSADVENLIQVDINKVQSSTNEETTTIYLNEVEYENREHSIKEEYLPISQTSCHADITRGQEQTLVDETGMSSEPAVQEEDDLDTKVPFHSILDVSAQKSRILLLRKTSVRRRPGQRPVMFPEELADPPAIPPLNMGVTPDPESSYPTEESTEMSNTSEPLLRRKSSIRRRGQPQATFQEELAGSSALPPLNRGMPPAPESSYPIEEATETSNASEPLLRRKSSIRRRGPRPVTFQEEPSLPLITPAESPHPTKEPRNESSISEQILYGKSSIHQHQGQHPVAFEDEPVEPSPPVITPLKMGVPHFLGGIPILSPAVAPTPELLHPAEEPRDEGTTSEPMLRRKSSVRRPKGKQTVTSEEQPTEPPLPATAPPRMGVALFPGVPAHMTPAPAPAHPEGESRGEKPPSEELIKPKKGFLKHAGFGGAHPGMMQELQARLHKKKPKE